MSYPCKNVYIIQQIDQYYLFSRDGNEYPGNRVLAQRTEYRLLNLVIMYSKKKNTIFKKSTRNLHFFKHSCFNDTILFLNPIVSNCRPINQIKQTRGCKLIYNGQYSGQS